MVESVERGYAASRAGLQPGDVISEWSRAPSPPANPKSAKGKFRSPFELIDVEVEQAPRGTLTLRGHRGLKRHTWVIPPGMWQVSTRPGLNADILHAYQEGRRLVEDDRSEEGIALWRQVAARPLIERRPLLAAWLQWRTATVLAHASQWKAADAAAEAAAVILRKHGVIRIAAHAYWTYGRLQQRLDPQRAIASYRQALALIEERPDSLATAHVLTTIGGPAVLGSQGDQTHLLTRALRIERAQAPGSMAVAATLEAIGWNAFKNSRDLWRTALNCQQAQELRRRLAPESIEFALGIGCVIAAPYQQGDLDTASRYLAQAARILSDSRGPDSMEVAAVHVWSSNIASKRHDIAALGAFAQKALDTLQRYAPNSLMAASAAGAAGMAALARGDLDTAERLLREALRVYETGLGGPTDLSLIHHNLGDVGLRRGDATAAEGQYRRALALAKLNTPETQEVAFHLRCLSVALARQGKFAAAEELGQEALRRRQRISPSSVDVWDSWLGLGEVALARQAWAEAEHRFRLATDHYDRHGSDVRLAASLHGLGLSLWSQGKRVESLKVLAHAIDVLDLHRGTLGASHEAGAFFSSQYADFFGDYAGELVAMDRPVEAFHVIERSRARALLDQLAQRDVRFAVELPPELGYGRASNRADYDRTLARLISLGALETDDAKQLRGRLRELRDRADEIARRIREASPRAASLQYPEPLQLDAARAGLDPGTVLLSFSTGEETTLLFIVSVADAGVDGLTVHTVPSGATALREKVDGFRRLIARRDLASYEALMAEAAALYDLLLRPADAQIAAAERLLIVPDGPLHTLPFAALVRTEAAQRGQSATPVLLAEWKPIHIAASATAYAELRKARRETKPPFSLVAFGDPTYPALPHDQPDAISDQDLRRAVDRGFSFSPLPATRDEVHAIASLFGPDAVVRTGADATEEAAKALAPKAQYLHFACHGLLDERSPLDSALALSIPAEQKEGQDNGLLQAWEIFDSVRVDAELVTLSACDSGRGREMGGEGLLGLTRAFQYAGARSVLASLWGVSDASTSKLMQRFYGHLKAGSTKDEALRLAQVETIRDPDGHPFDWAAFQLFGDWR